MSETKEQVSNTKKKRVVFTEDETHALLSIWASEEMQHKFTTSLRHNLIWNMIAQLHRCKGYSKSGAEVKSKINNLKTEYRNIKPKSGSATPTWPYFKIMNKVLGERAYADDSLLDDSMSTIQAPEDDFESNLSDSMPNEEVCSIDNSSDVPNESEGDSLDNSVKSHRNTIGKQAAWQTVNTKKSCGTNREVMQKIARPPRKKGSDENQLIKTLIEAEKRYSQRLTVIEEQEKKAQDREDVLAQSMNRFLTAFAVLAEKSANLGTTLLGPPAPFMATPQLAAQGNSTNEDSQLGEFNSDGVNQDINLQDDETCIDDETLFIDQKIKVHNIEKLVGKDILDVNNLQPMRKVTASYPLKNILQPLKHTSAKLNSSQESSIGDKSPATRTINKCNIQQLVGKRTRDVENLQPAKKVIGLYPLKLISQPSQDIPPQIKSSAQLIRLKKAVQDPPLDTGNVSNIYNKASMPKKDGIIYITLAKDQ